MQADTEKKQVYIVTLKNKVKTAAVEIQNMKLVMQTMAEVVQTMQSIMMSNASAGLSAPGAVVGERPEMQR